MTRNYAEEDWVKKGIASLGVSLGATEGDVAQIDADGGLTLAAGNGGSITPAGIVLQSSTGFEIAAAGSLDLAFDTAYDDTYDFNTITEVPAGLGMTLALDGLNANFTTTTAGVWWFGLNPSNLPNDATLVISYGQGRAGMGLISAAGTGISPGYITVIPYAEAVYLPSGATSQFICNTLNAATAGSIVLRPQATIIRLV